MQMDFRIARIEDSRLLFDWANDPEVRRMAFSSGPIAWQDHTRWFEEKIKDPDAYIYIAIEDNAPIGQIRFDIIDSCEARVDIHIKPDMRGKGLGARMIALGVARFFSDCRANAVRAVIKHENLKSRKAFKRAGFEDVQKQTVHGEACFFMVKKRKSHMKERNSH